MIGRFLDWWMRGVGALVPPSPSVRPSGSDPPCKGSEPEDDGHDVIDTGEGIVHLRPAGRGLPDPDAYPQSPP